MGFFDLASSWLTISAREGSDKKQKRPPLVSGEGAAILFRCGVSVYGVELFGSEREGLAAPESLTLRQDSQP